MASERSKRRDLLACIFITKSISKKLLIKNLFLAKIIMLDFTGVCFDAIVHPDRVTE